MSEENKNEEPVKKASLEEVLASRLKQIDKICVTLTNSLNEDNELIKKHRDKVIALKSENKEATFQDVREELISIKETFFLVQMKQKEWERCLILLSELYELCVLTNIPLDITEEQKKSLDLLISKDQSFFIVNPDANTVKIADHEAYEARIAPSKVLAMSDAKLEEVFNSQFLTVK